MSLRSSMHSGLQFKTGDFSVLEGQVPMIVIDYEADAMIPGPSCYDTGVSILYADGSNPAIGEYWYTQAKIFKVGVKVCLLVIVVRNSHTCEVSVGVNNRR